MSHTAKGALTTRVAIIVGGLVVVAIVLLGTLWMSATATKDTEEAVHTVSLLYLDELAGRREQVVKANLENSIRDLGVGIDLLEPEDLQDVEHLQAYQRRMRQLYNIEKFAFVDESGLIYTADGTLETIDNYDFDHLAITGPEISVLNLDSADKKVIIAVPTDIPFMDTRLTACFMEIDMDVLLAGVSMESDEEAATFCNIYTSTGVALTDTILGGLAVEDNLLEAMQHATFDEGYSYEQFASEFGGLQRGVTCFTYNGIRETLSYVPVKGTDWQLTYLVRESVIGESVKSISDDIIARSILQSVLTIVALVLLFTYVIVQNRAAAHQRLEHETAEAASRAHEQELEEKLALQERLLEEERSREQQTQLITALSSDYRSVYYIELDRDEGVCYQEYTDLDHHLAKGEHFPYLASVTAYAEEYVTDEYREEFLRFSQPEAIRAALAENRVIGFRYLVNHGGHELWEMVRFAGVRHPEDRDDHLVHSVGACFTDVDDETRKQLAQNQALSDALAEADRANHAKTSFLSNMSHEIRTPMNAIIGLDTIALNDPDTPEQTREYLQKIGDSADHLLSLINDILDMSRIESGRMTLKNEKFSFSRLLEGVNTMFSGQCQDRGLNYQCHIKGEVDDAYIGDSVKLRQVLINILGNAVKFTPAGGSVELDVERKAQFGGRTTLSFTIKDTGIGISEDFLPHLFSAFSQEDSSATSKYGSSGLGLAITKNIVDMMNGAIEVESEKGKGTTFVVSVTLADCEDEDAGAEVRVSPHDMNVLIVDDDPIACEHAKLVLEKAGIASEVAGSGAEAIEMVRLRHARRDPYNLILVDWKMPEMDGVETTRRIREIVDNESAIIILTAYRWDDVLEEAIEAGVDSFIPKPLFASQVIDEFRSALVRKGMTSSSRPSTVDLEGKRVLLAEDVEVNAEIMVMVLEMRGMLCEVAVNGRIAVDMFDERPAGYYDAILMDMRMPEMGGLDATRIIRAMDRPDAKEIPIIALTANAFDEDVQRSLQAGLNAHLSKPVQPEVLFETLESLIRE